MYSYVRECVVVCAHFCVCLHVIHVSPCICLSCVRVPVWRIGSGSTSSSSDIPTWSFLLGRQQSDVCKISWLKGTNKEVVLLLARGGAFCGYYECGWKIKKKEKKSTSRDVVHILFQEKRRLYCFPRITRQSTHWKCWSTPTHLHIHMHFDRCLYRAFANYVYARLC